MIQILDLFLYSDNAVIWREAYQYGATDKVKRIKKQIKSYLFKLLTCFVYPGNGSSAGVRLVPGTQPAIRRARVDG